MGHGGDVRDMELDVYGIVQWVVDDWKLHELCEVSRGRREVANGLRGDIGRGRNSKWFGIRGCRGPEREIKLRVRGLLRLVGRMDGFGMGCGKVVEEGDNLGVDGMGTDGVHQIGILDEGKRREQNGERERRKR